MSDAFIARQPIFDREQRLVGYELLFRPSANASAAGRGDSLHMTSATLVNSVLAIGLEQTTGGSRAWINFPRELLIERDFELLDPARFSIEVLETVDCDAETVAACQAARDKGYTIVLDDFVAGEEYEPFLKLAHVVKLDVLGVSEQQLTTTLRRLAPYKVQVLAEKVQDTAAYTMCRRLGFTLFQGYHFSRPETVRRKDLPAESFGIGRLMNLVLDSHTHDRELEREFRADPGLSYRLLRIVNSAAAGGSGIESIQQAIRLIGRASLHRWLALMFVNSVPRKTGVEQELVLNAIERGRMCEVMALQSGRKSAAASLFLTGVLSTFDVILGLPMPELLRHVKVAPEVEAALLREQGPYTPYLTLATSYANGNWDSVLDLGGQMGLLNELPKLATESAVWARDVLQRN